MCLLKKSKGRDVPGTKWVQFVCHIAAGIAQKSRCHLGGKLIGVSSLRQNWARQSWLLQLSLFSWSWVAQCQKTRVKRVHFLVSELPRCKVRPDMIALCTKTPICQSKQDAHCTKVERSEMQSFTSAFRFQNWLQNQNIYIMILLIMQNFVVQK